MAKYELVFLFWQIGVLMLQFKKDRKVFIIFDSHLAAAV